MRDLIFSVKQVATLRTMCSLILLLALFVTSTSVWGVKQDLMVDVKQGQVVNAMRGMASNWNGLKNIFAGKAIVKFCKQGEEATCQQGSFDDLFGPFEDAVKLVYFRAFRLDGGINQRVSASLDSICRNAFGVSGYLGWVLEL
jgi:hypothetical protein